MGWFSREPRDTSALSAALRRGSHDEFLKVYEPKFVNYDGYSGTTLLDMALRNSNPEARVSIAHRLLDDGAKAGIGIPLHSLLGNNAHDFAAEPALLHRLLESGADVNQSLARSGTPLEALAGVGKFTDAQLQPFYDVILDWPALDLLRPGRVAPTVLATLRRGYARRACLVEQAEAVLTARGVPLPPPER